MSDLGYGRLMRKVVFLFLSFIIAQNVYASDTSFSKWISHYQRLETLQGNCPELLTVKQEDFLNQRSKHSLSFTDHNSAMIYQLSGLNAGSDLQLTYNPISGLCDGSVTNSEVLTQNTIVAVTTTRDLFGQILWQTTFTAQIHNRFLTYQKTIQRRLTEPSILKIDICSYQID